MSAIEWTDRTWNPVRGCSRVSEGCRNCYAERFAARFSKPGKPFHGFAKVVAPRDSLDRVGKRRNGWTGRVELIPEKLGEPLSWRKPALVFVNSMSDLFHEALPDDAIDNVFAVMALAPQHTFQVLTKRPERMLAYCSDPGRLSRIADRAAKEFDAPEESMGLSWPPQNVWLGVSVEDQATADERVPPLLQTQAAKRFVSYEPALEEVNLHLGRDSLDAFSAAPPLDWVIVGGESGPGARPFDLAWARSVLRQCREAGVACFVKQLGARAVEAPVLDSPARISMGLRHPKGGYPAEWPEDVRAREFPQ